MSFIRKAVQALLARVPATLPQTQAEIDAWCQSVAVLAGAEPTPQTKGAIAETLLRMDIRKVRITKLEIARQLQRQIANEAAYHLIQQIRTEQAEARAEQAQEQAAGAESAPSEVVPET